LRRWQIIDRFASIATLCVAIVALAWAHYDSSQQSEVLDQSRIALGGVLTNVQAEATSLKTVSAKLTTANGELDKLQQHAAATVDDLQRADAALRDVLATSRSLSTVDREIFRTSERQLSLLASEHAEEVARENAAPYISVQLMYARGDATFTWNPIPRPWSNRAILPPQGGEQVMSWGLVLTNSGSSVAQDVVAFVGVSPNPGVSGCIPLPQGTFQCGSPDIARRGAGLVRFNIAAPKSPGLYIISVTILTRKVNGTIAPFNAAFPVYLRPPQSNPAVHP
jgi:hypothetical protein